MRGRKGVFVSYAQLCHPVTCSAAPSDRQALLSERNLRRPLGTQREREREREYGEREGCIPNLGRAAVIPRAGSMSWARGADRWAHPTPLHGPCDLTEGLWLQRRHVLMLSGGNSWPLATGGGGVQLIEINILKNRARVGLFLRVRLNPVWEVDAGFNVKRTFLRGFYFVNDCMTHHRREIQAPPPSNSRSLHYPASLQIKPPSPPRRGLLIKGRKRQNFCVYQNQEVVVTMVTDKHSALHPAWIKKKKQQKGSVWYKIGQVWIWANRSRFNQSDHWDKFSHFGFLLTADVLWFCWAQKPDEAKGQSWRLYVVSPYVLLLLLLLSLHRCRFSV